MRRRAISAVKAIIAVVVIFFILGGSFIFLLLTVPAFTIFIQHNTGIDVNKITSSFGENLSVPMGITVETNNATLAKSIITVDGQYSPAELESHALILQPNVTYVFNITIVPVNAQLQPINVPWNITVHAVNFPYINGTMPRFGGIFATFPNNSQEISGITPINTQLVINMPPDSTDAITLYTPSGANGQNVIIYAKTQS